MRLIQAHLDNYGVKRAEFARRAGTTPQTVQNWQDRPRTLPNVKHLKGVAEVTGIPYLIVLDAALKDAGYRDTLVDDIKTLRVRIARAARASDNVIGEIQDYLENGLYFPDDDAREMEAIGVEAGLYGPAIDHVIDRYGDYLDGVYGYGNDRLIDRERARELIADRVTELEEQSVRPAAWQEGEDWSAGWGPGGEDPGMGGHQEGEQRDQL
jgi:transcriptional regulator with XRE-family HTH domain